jgi:hypothetical protein
MAVLRTVLSRKGLIQSQHGLTGYEADQDANWLLLDSNVAFTSDLPGSLYPLAPGTGLNLLIGAGYAWVAGSLIVYAGGSLAMAASATNYVFLNPAASYAPGSNTSGFPATSMPLAVVTTTALAISAITDRRTPFMMPAAAASGPAATISLTTAGPGNFTQAHSLGRAPTACLIELTSAGAIWFQTPTKYDVGNVYLVAADTGLTADLKLW